MMQRVWNQTCPYNKLKITNSTVIIELVLNWGGWGVGQIKYFIIIIYWSNEVLRRMKAYLEFYFLWSSEILLRFFWHQCLLPVRYYVVGNLTETHSSVYHIDNLSSTTVTEDMLSRAKLVICYLSLFGL